MGAQNSVSGSDVGSIRLGRHGAATSVVDADFAAWCCNLRLAESKDISELRFGIYDIGYTFRSMCSSLWFDFG